LGFGTFFIAITLHHARDWTVFNTTSREYIAQYGAVVAIVTWTMVANFGTFKDANPAYIDVPDDYKFTATARLNPTGAHDNCGPYCHTESTVTGALEFEQYCSSERSWLIDIFDTEIVPVIIALPCGALLTLLFFFDHNVSSLLTQDPSYNLKKGSAFHYDFFVLGINVLICGLFGLPTANGLIPQAPLHVRALAKISVTTDKVTGQREEVFEEVCEQRLSNVLQSAIMLAVMLFFEVPGVIPKAVLQGIFLYMGVTTLDGLTFTQRLLMLMQERERMPPYPFVKDKDNLKVVKIYTLLQFAIWCAIFGVSGPWAGSIAIVFPFLIAVLVPIREHLLPRFFGEPEVLFIDTCGASCDDTPNDPDDPDNEHQLDLGNSPASTDGSGAPGIDMTPPAA